MSAEPIAEPASARPVRIPFGWRRSAAVDGDRARAATARHGWNGHERRSADRLRRLARDYDALCTAAVDAAEIAAGLEASGFTDGSAQEYGFPGVFGLAEALFGTTPRLADRSPGRLANPWAERPMRHLARGVTFALPGLVLVACLPELDSRADLAALVVAMLVGWPASQTMAFLGFALEGRRHPRAAAALLLVGVLVSLLTAAVLGTVAVRCGVSTRVATIAAAEIVYVTSAAVVLVLSHELVILGALLPGLAAAAWTRSVHGAPGWLLGAGAATSVALVVIAAVVACADARPRDLRTGFGSLTRHDAVEVLFHVGYGLAGGALVTAPALAGGSAAGGGLGLLPVIWSMGGAEWNVVRLRRRSFDLLNTTISVTNFQRSVRRLAVASVARYLVQLSALTLLLVAGFRLATGALPGTHLAIALLASWVLGAGFYLALMLTSLGRVRVVVPGMLLGVALGLAADLGLHQASALLVGPAVLVIGLAPVLRRTIANPVLHM
jgi:hypothetical protein